MTSPSLPGLFISILLAVGNIPQVFPSSAIVETSNVWTKIGGDVELFCSSLSESHPLDICRWTKTNAELGTRELLEFKQNLLIKDKHLEEDEEGGGGQFDFACGKRGGMDKGDCGLRIYNISKNQLGNWECALIGHGQDEFWIGNVHVPLIEKPTKLKIRPREDLDSFIDSQNGIGIGSIGSLNSTFICCVEGGKPIDQTILNFTFDGISIPAKLYRDKDVSSTDISCIRWETSFGIKDNGKNLTCKVKHPAYLNEDVNDLSDWTELRFYRPNFLQSLERNRTEFITTKKDSDGNLVLEIKVKSNPKPGVEIRWKGNDKGREMILKPEEDYILKIVSDSSGLDGEYGDVIEYEIHLKNKTASLKTGGYSLMVKVSNAFGNAEEIVEIEIVSPPEGAESGSTFWTVLMIGIGMSILFVLIIVYMLNFTAKRKGWWCYRNRTQKYPVSRKKSPAEEYSTVGRDESGEDVGF